MVISNLTVKQRRFGLAITYIALTTNYFLHSLPVGSILKDGKLFVFIELRAYRKSTSKLYNYVANLAKAAYN